MTAPVTFGNTIQARLRSDEGHLFSRHMLTNLPEVLSIRPASMGVDGRKGRYTMSMVGHTGMVSLSNAGGKSAAVTIKQQEQNGDLFLNIHYDPTALNQHPLFVGPEGKTELNGHRFAPFILGHLIGKGFPVADITLEGENPPEPDKRPWYSRWLSNRSA